MSNRCSFSFGSVDIPPTTQDYAAQCPDCGAIRDTVRRGAGRVFPVHAPLVAKPQDRACWKRDDLGTWTWKPVEYVGSIMYVDGAVVAHVERKQA